MILDSVTTYLVGLFSTAVSPTRAYAGPYPPAVNAERFVVVNSAGDDPPEDTATAELTPSTLGPGTWLDETGEVTCSAFAWSGDTDVDTVRTSALALANACVGAVQDDRTLGGLLFMPTAVTSDLVPTTAQFATGALCRVTFSVTYSHLNT